MTYELKTKITDAKVGDYLAAISDLARREDMDTLVDLLAKTSGCAPKMWGTSIVGFDEYHYKYPSGQEGDWMAIGVSSRKAEISVYLMTGFAAAADDLAKLGKHKMGKSCLNIKRVSDVDLKVLEKLLKQSLAATKSQYPKS
jgi:hypothetical protein